MPFEILAISERGLSPRDRRYPVPGEQPGTVELTETDGEALPPIAAVEASVSEMWAGQLKPLVSVSKIKAAVIVTESRVALVSNQYGKRRLRNPRRRQERMLGGQVPYELLVEVGVREATGRRGRERLRLTMFDFRAAGDRALVLDLFLPSGSGAAAWSRRIATLAAKQQLAFYNDSLDPDRRAGLQELCESPSPLEAPADDGFVSYVLMYGGPTTASAYA